MQRLIFHPSFSFISRTVIFLVGELAVKFGPTHQEFYELRTQLFTAKSTSDAVEDLVTREPSNIAERMLQDRLKVLFRARNIDILSK